MRQTTRNAIFAVGGAAVTLVAAVSLEALGEGEIPEGYNTPIPESIMTPDQVKTRLGTLEFKDGMPTKETVETAYENLDFMRGVEVFLNFIPATSIEGIRRGMAELGVTKSNQCVLFDRLMDSRPLFLTGNTDTVYASVMLDLERDGPTVVEIPPNCGPGTVNDAFFRFVIDMGFPGPDRGKGGKYLILPPGHDLDIDAPIGGAEVEVGGTKYFAAESPTYTQWLILRGFLVDGKPDAATKMFKEGLKVYPLSAAAAPPAMEFVSGSAKHFNTIHANDFEFYEELHDVLAKEPLSFIDPELRGLAAAIGIRKGAPFAPDARMKATLTEAVAVGNATARAILFAPRDPTSYLYEDRRWFTPFIGGSHEWLRDGGNGGRYMDARTAFFYGATVNTPAMALKMIGKGSQYAYDARDANGNYLEGAKTYRLNVPGNVPAKDFWSVVAYDPQTRSELQTSQTFPSKNNERDDLAVNEDGSVDLWFGPQAPDGKESNWIQTVPGKNFIVLIRLYGPLEPWFDRTWRPGDFELVD